MSDEGFRIPAEITGFFDGEPGRSLLVKGSPGSGKTIFAFTMLHETGRNGVYLSTRVDPESLHNQIGWLRKSLPAENIIDATQSGREKAAIGAPAVRPLKYTDVPDFLRGVYQRTERLERPMVIIDSWDAVVAHTGFYDPREREKLEHNLTDFSRKTGTDFIFIAEYVEQKPLDYLVDGAIIMEKGLYDDRRIRTLTLDKLRGRAIRQPTYLVSLAEGIFRSFPSLRVGALGKLKLPAIPDLAPGRLSSGIEGLDAIIGGYGSFNLCRGDRTSYDLLLLPFILNSLSLGRIVMLPPSERTMIKNSVLGVSDDLLKHLKTIPEEFSDGLAEKVAQIASEAKAAAPACFLNLTELAKHGHTIAIETVYQIVEKGGFVFGFASDETSLPAELESIAATSLVTKTFFGVPCFYGRLPPTEIYALETEADGASLTVSLTPII